jgi:hypothetical protein
LVGNAWKDIAQEYPAAAAFAAPPPPTKQSAAPHTPSQVSDAEIAAARELFAPDETYAKQTDEVKAEIDAVARLVAINRAAGVANDAELSEKLAKVVDQIDF